MPDAIRMCDSVEDCRQISVADTLTGAAGIVDVWYWCYEPATESTLIDACGPLLAGEECDRYKAFRFERDRRLFLATRMLARTVLSQYAEVRPDEWRFQPDRSGKPRIAHPEARPPLHFNLANTEGLAVCAVSVAHELVGVDAERIDRRVDFMGLADRCFSASEAGALQALTLSEQRRRFFTYWTLKESYVKARGVGLALPLDRFSFTLNDDDISVAFEAEVADDAALWRFRLVDVVPSYLIAVSAKTGGAALSMRAAHVVPLDLLCR